MNKNNMCIKDKSLELEIVSIFMNLKYDIAKSGIVLMEKYYEWANFNIKCLNNNQSIPQIHNIYNNIETFLFVHYLH